MKMSKKILAVALAAATLGMSTGAMALTFTDGDFNGGVDIGGDINVPVATNYWQWAAGDAQTFTHNVTQLTNSYKTLTIPAATNITLLVGQTKQATVGSGAGGINPQVSLQDAKGNKITPTWDESSNSGKGVIVLPVTKSDGVTALGNMTLKVKATEVQAGMNANGTITETLSLFSADGKNILPTTQAGVPASGAAALTWANAIGVTKTRANMLSDLNTLSGLSISAWTGDFYFGFGKFSDPATFYTGAYGLGIAQGDNIVINFTNPITATTDWKTQLKMTVTYI